MGMKVMELEKMKEDLRKDIQELYDYTEMERSKKENVLLNRIGILGFILLPISIVTGLMAMNFSSFSSFHRALFLFLLLLFYIITTSLILWKKPIKIKINKVIIGICGLLSISILVIIFKNYSHDFKNIFTSIKNILFH